jgi:ABC-type multidrug transport system fused ATPase/permease subunit
MVIEEGRVVELASPSSLLADTSSLFYSLAKNAGITQTQ